MLYRVVKRNVPPFENSRPSAAWQLGQPMHSQSANFGKFKLNSLNLFYSTQGDRGDLTLLFVDFELVCSSWSLAELKCKSTKSSLEPLWSPCILVALACIHCSNRSFKSWHIQLQHFAWGKLTFRRYRPRGGAAPPFSETCSSPTRRPTTTTSPSSTTASSRDELFKNRSSRKTDSQKRKRSSGSPIPLIIVSENWFSGKTYFYTIASRSGPACWTASWPRTPSGCWRTWWTAITASLVGTVPFRFINYIVQ